MAAGALMDLILHAQKHAEADRKLEFELATIPSLLEVVLHVLGATKLLHLVVLFILGSRRYLWVPYAFD